MSKRKLKKYLDGLSKPQLEDQVLELYDRLKEVRQFYDFVFNPKEDKMLDEAKMKISLEYFPAGKRKKVKKRRSVANKYIKEFKKLGVQPMIVADLMLYNIEIALAYNEENTIKQEAFYKAMYKSFQDVVKYIDQNGLQVELDQRLENIIDQVYHQNWVNKAAFEVVMSKRIR